MYKNTLENLATFKKQAATRDYVDNSIETRTVSLNTDQSIQSDKSFEGVVTHNDNVVFNETVFIRDGFVGPDNNKVEVSDISLANNLENGQGNGALIQTNKVLETGNEWESSDDDIATVDENGVVTAVAPGEAVIACTRENADALCLVTVKPRFMFGASQSDIANYTLVTDLSTVLPTDDLVILNLNITSGTVIGVTGWDGKKDATVSEDISAWCGFKKVVIGNKICLQDSKANSYIQKVTANEFKYTTEQNLAGDFEIGTTASDTSALILKEANRQLCANGSNYRFYGVASNYSAFRLYKRPTPDPVESITLLENTLELDAGNEYQLSFEVLPSTAIQDVIWSSSDESIATVDKFGNISAGIFATDQTVTITATTKGKTAGGQTLSASCEVTVKKYVGPAIKLSSGHLSLRVGESRQLLVSYAQTNVASGVSSVALGHATNVSGNRSLACGDSLVSAYEDQVVIGKFNNNRADTILEVGNGSIETPSNAFEVYKNGNVKISGNTITIGNTTITEAQLQQLLTLL